VLDHLLQPLARGGVEGVRDLVDVHVRARLVDVDAATVGDVAALGPPGEPDLHEAVGDARERELAHGHPGPARQGRAVVLDRERDLRLAVVGEVYVPDRPDRHAAAQHRVAAHELRGVLKAGRDAVPAAVAEQHDRDQRDRGDPHGGQHRPHPHCASLKADPRTSVSVEAIEIYTWVSWSP
jgi:hypothetical protein